MYNEQIKKKIYFEKLLKIQIDWFLGRRMFSSIWWLCWQMCSTKNNHCGLMTIFFQFISSGHWANTQEGNKLLPAEFLRCIPKHSVLKMKFNCLKDKLDVPATPTSGYTDGNGACDAMVDLTCSKIVTGVGRFTFCISIITEYGSSCVGMIFRTTDYLLSWRCTKFQL